MLTVGSLFTGIGGIDLGLERAGMEIRWQCEIDPYCRKVLAKHWPGVPCYEDVRNLPDDIEGVDLVCGGYPCQPFSFAGSRSGTDDARHLWPAFADALRVLRPTYALLENVPGHVSLGFDEVLADLSEMGYDAEWTCIPAAAVGAPHLRWRLFVLAYAQQFGPQGGDDTGGGEGLGQAWDESAGGRTKSGGGALADAEFDRLERRGESGRPGPRRQRPADGGENVANAERVAVGAGLRASEQTGQWGRRPGDIGGAGNPWAVEPDVGRVAYGVPHRVDRLRALGNAVVPQVAELIGRMLLEEVA